MALNIKDPEAERLAAEVAVLAHENKTQAVRVALRERRDRLVHQQGGGPRRQRLLLALRTEIWPMIPAGASGTSLSKQDQELILGLGPDGV